MTKKIIFYESMSYPYPTQEEQYRYINEISRKEYQEKIQESDSKWGFSRAQSSTLMDEYREHILSYAHVFASLPFVRQIYLCNSITFNALHPGSDIDLCIICAKGSVRAARIWSVLFFLWYKIKRSSKKDTDQSKKFCLSFYIDESTADIYHLRQTEGDRYLVYRLAHSVLLYSDDTLADDFLRQHNRKLLSFLPYHPLQQTIDIAISPIREERRIKKILERISRSWIGKSILKVITQIRKQWIYYKKKKLSVHVQKYIIISNTILKFYNDKRPLIQHKIKTWLSKW